MVCLLRTLAGRFLGSKEIGYDGVTPETSPGLQKLVPYVSYTGWWKDATLLNGVCATQHGAVRMLDSVPIFMLCVGKHDN